MKRFFLLMLSIWRQQLKVYLTVALTGAIIGIFVLAPSYDYIYAREQTIDPLSSIEYVLKQIASLFTGNLSDESAALLIFYAEIGAMLGLLSLVLYKFIHQRLINIDHLKTELDKDLLSIIQKGEGSYLEFKSSLRWDMVESRVNRSLEGVVLKTLAGFLNSHLSGTLLIGVSDDGQIIGLDKDYQTLKKPNQDGFEQNLMAAISNNLGTDLCQFVHVLFHVVDNNEVCRLIVSPAPRPVFLDQGNTPKFFVRTGGGTRDLNIREALDYIHGRWKRVK
ncbi:MAG: ATP-binding protein [Methylobacter sp.]|uniref:ATP-binding protein n=1 Tax=Candidatus Methylobacter titanis TaxID=3053457 RepID=A0AA43Q9I2_9GAMM|nr:ATP-binding protein [Candidatus Methylobacter titanis]